MMPRGSGKTFQFLLMALTLLSGCGGGGEGRPGGGVGGRDVSQEVPGARIVFCPKDGGEVKFLGLDSLNLVGSNFNIPDETLGFAGILPDSRFAALTTTAVYLFPVDQGTEMSSIGLPSLSSDVELITAGEELFLLDRKYRRLIGVDPRKGEVVFDRTFEGTPQEVYYDPGGDRIVLVMKNGNRGALSTLSVGGGESMTINIDAVICSAGARGGSIYLATRGAEGSRLEAFRVKDLSRIFQVDLKQEPGSMTYAPGTGKVYLYFSSTGMIRAIRMDGGDMVSEIPLDRKGKGELMSDWVGRHVYLLNEEGGHLTAVSTDKDLIVGEIEGQDADSRLIVTPDSRFILIQDTGGSRVRLYDGSTFQLLRVFMEEAPARIGLLRETKVSRGETNIQVAGGKAPAKVPLQDQEAPTAASTVNAGSEADLFTLQVFSSDSLASSQEVVDELLAAGFPAFVEKALVSGKGTWYRVRVGEFESREDADAVGGYLKGLFGLEYWATPMEDLEKGETEGLDLDLKGQDMDGDGLPEVAIVDAGGVIHLFSLRGSRYVSRWSYPLPADQDLCGTINYVDGNGDGLPEAVLPLCPLDGDYRIAWDGASFSGVSG